ncbi:MAG: DsbA family protein [Solirubrobacteraceae bacterium]
MSPAASFYFDLSSPEAYMAAERILHVLPGPAEWQPVLARELGGGGRHDAICGEQGREGLRAELSRRVDELGLQPLRLPDPFPFDSALAMRVATYAKSIGRTVPFAQAAFRQAFAGGHGLDQLDHVLIAAAACEMHPSAVIAALEMRSVGDRLSQCTARARRAGVLGVPAVLVGDMVFHGERAIEDAALQMRGERLAGRGLPG